MPVALHSRLIHLLVVALTLCMPAAHADQDSVEPLGVAMEGFQYPYPVEYLPLTMEGQMVKMAYMDVAPTGKPNGRNRVAPEVRDTMGRFTELIPAAARVMPNAAPVLLSNVGHIAHLEIPEKFHAIVSSFLGK